MNQLLKYILFVNIIFIVLFGVLTVTNVIYENYKDTAYTQSEIDSIHSEGNLVPVPKGPLYSFGVIFMNLFLYIIPILIILTSGIYQYKNPTIRSYAKSLLIPLSYIFIAFFSTLLWAKLVGISGEEGMAFLFFWMQFAITFFAVVIINFIVFLFKRA